MKTFCKTSIRQLLARRFETHLKIFAYGNFINIESVEYCMESSHVRYLSKSCDASEIERMRAANK